jgi:hypothetical protein
MKSNKVKLAIAALIAVSIFGGDLLVAFSG